MQYEVFFRLFCQGYCRFEVLCVDYWVLQSSDLVQFDDYIVAGLKPYRGLARKTHALRCAGKDDGAGQQSRVLAEIFYDLSDGEDHIAGGVVLHGAVDSGQ